ncbi:glucose-6-phosphate isomerase [Candidiatus Paracoxiella cheracis]|uniref:glucose-6-phosphate isomerase n=1 Tax=Candidiatus Paracoxiella cheracis TaxID=3405120 RepID=UPI003BF4A230
MTKLTQTSQWHALQTHYRNIANAHMRDLFLADPRRGEEFFLEAAGLYLDYSKNRITTETMQRLIELANVMRVAPQIESLFKGDLVNCTEKTAALHTALRNLGDKPVLVNGRDVMLDIHASWDQMKTWSDLIRSGHYKGFSGKAIQDVVNIGVGGSDLGPLMVYQALMPYVQNNIRCHFISNQDEFHIRETLKRLNPETTLFIITSKSFGTKETLDNANRAKQWLLDVVGDETRIKPHFLAITAKAERAINFGLLPDHIFPLWEWVGGRYSIWSSVGLSLAIAIGMERFQEFLAGAYAMDQHFRHTELSQNMPVILALLTIWYSNFFHAQSRAIIPYSQQLLYLPDYLKQLHMESQGKSIQRDGDPVDYATGVIIWGGIGSNSQHSFHQLFLQGNQLAPIDFILPLKNYSTNRCQYDLIANCLSQSETLMHGYDLEQVMNDLHHQGIRQEEANMLAPHKIISGNYPSNTILMECITPYNLGALLALYEHKIYVQSLIWNINAFDQWGVERGKTIARKILKNLEQSLLTNEPDNSMQPLIKKILSLVEK